MQKGFVKLKFIDFCAGIGGGRLGLENLGWNALVFPR
ncbi:MAG: hypothetical protein US35_C0003G0008 [Parcubacteria group bacterium GW2011_GWA2_37_10]|nr:MAG: hypothetical protein US35_C0003G0008 [Parcubacteria group bacterium GW2011_GWA2_37_10]